MTRDHTPAAERPFADPAVAQAFAAFPPAARSSLMAVRALIFEVAERTDGAGPLEETLKWGEPAYLTTHSRSGSTIRLGWKKALPPAQAGACALYFNCNTHLVDTFRTLFPRGFRFEGNRAIVFAPHEAPDSDALALCIRAALNYHRDKKPSRRA